MLQVFHAQVPCQALHFSVWKWLLPKGLSQAKSDLAALKETAMAKAQGVRQKVQGLLDKEDMDGALAAWGKDVETVVLSSSQLPVGCWKNFKVGVAGPGEDWAPSIAVWQVRWFSARYVWANPQDRLQNLERLIRAAEGSATRVRGICGLLLRARLVLKVVSCGSCSGKDSLFLSPSLTFTGLRRSGCGYKSGFRLWCEKIPILGGESWRTSGGALPCRLIRDRQMPHWQNWR